jgi:regulator of protease activity HflC (stomatin/prohibitin superfamily)
MKLRSIILSSIVSVLAIILLLGIKVIEPGEVGVRSTLGDVHQTILPAGIHVISPFVDNVTTFSIRTKDLPEEFASITKDGQTMKVTATALYALNPIKAPSIYVKIGSSDADVRNKVIQPALLGAVKQVISKYGMFEVIENQNKISQEVETTIKELLNGNDFIIFNSFTVTGFTLDKEVQASIEQKQIAQQQLQRKSIEVEIATKESERLNILSKAITPNTLMLDAISKWDGKGIPPTLGGNTSLLVQAK